MRIDGRLAVGRLGKRSDSDFAWETELLQYLDRQGFAVPVPILTKDGRLFANGLVVMSYVEGESPASEADWRRVAATLRRMHASDGKNVSGKSTAARYYDGSTTWDAGTLEYSGNWTRIGN